MFYVQSKLFVCVCLLILMHKSMVFSYEDNDVNINTFLKRRVFCIEQIFVK